MSKILLLAASVAVALVSFTAASDAHTHHLRAPRAFYGYYGYAPGYYARQGYESPMYAPDVPPSRNFYNPGIPDFQLAR
jgi:hypothetical protein